MIRLAMNKKLFHIAFVPFFGLKNTHDVSEEKQAEVTPTKIAIDKVKHFFYDENGHVTKEIQSIISATTVGIVSGFIIGGTAKTRSVTEAFIAESQAAVFKSHYEAKRLLQYKIGVAIFKGGIPFGIKLGTFCFLFSSTSAVLQIYKGKFDISNHVISGAVAGSVYKMNMGLKGAFAGGILGSLLGTFSGIVSSLLLYVTGTEMGDLYDANNKWIISRKEIIREQTNFLSEEEKEFRNIYNENLKKKEETKEKQ